MKREWVEILRARLRGRIWSPPPTSACHDFGRVLERRPEVVAEATCEADVLAALAICRDRQIPLVVRGAGHSCGGQALGQGGLVLWNRSDEPDARLEGDVVEVSGRTTWNGLEAFLGARGRTPLVMPDHLDLSVGGTLSVGGYGVRSVAWGSQIDRVRSIRLITPNGEVAWRSVDDPVVRHTLAGLGALGVIERVRMPTLARRPAVRWCTQAFDRLGALARWLRWVEKVEHPDLWLDAWWEGGGGIAEWGIEAPDLEAARAASVPGPVPQHDKIAWHLPLQLHEQRWRWVQRFAGHRRLWADFMLPHAPFVELCELLDRYHAGGGPCPAALYILVSRLPQGHLPAAYSPSPWPVSYGIGAYFMVPLDASTTAAEQGLAHLQERATALGARPYRYGWGASAPWDDDMIRLRASVGAGEWFAPRRPAAQSIQSRGDTDAGMSSRPELSKTSSPGCGNPSRPKRTTR